MQPITLIKNKRSQKDNIFGFDKIILIDRYLDFVERSTNYNDNPVEIYHYAFLAIADKDLTTINDDYEFSEIISMYYEVEGE